MHCSKQHFYSITSSASASTVGGISRLSVLAVLRLITNSDTLRSSALAVLRLMTSSNLIITEIIYCEAVVVWLAVLGIVLFEYVRNPRIFGTTRLLLLVVAIDTCRNLIENVYFGLFFGGQYGFFPTALAESLGNPALVIIPKMLNIVAGGFVLGLLLLRWLPQAVTARGLSDRLVVDLGMLATTDGLTALFNRRHFEELARAEWARFQRYGRPLSLLLLDIDNFKSINDRFGHDAGDLVLKLSLI